MCAAGHGLPRPGGERPGLGRVRGHHRHRPYRGGAGWACGRDVLCPPASEYQTIAKKGPESRFSLLNDFLLASNYAGLAFGTAGCAAVHATSYPLGGKYHVAHGESNYAMFTGVLKNYMELRRDGEIAVLNQYLADLLGCMTNVVYDELEKLLDQILPKRPLREYGVTREDLPVFAHSVVTEQGRLMANNFVPLDEARVLKIYQELF